MQQHSSNYWENRYRHKDTPWDLDQPHPAITQYFEQIDDKTQKILIPGAGYGHEAEWLWMQGYHNVYLCDWAGSALEDFSNRVPKFPAAQLIEQNFFDLNDSFDIIVEHTFFCALSPSLRPDYVAHSAQLLRDKKGYIIGVLFAEDLGPDGPPFGGTVREYRTLFKQQFQEVQFRNISEKNSPRTKREVLFTSKIC